MELKDQLLLEDDLVLKGADRYLSSTKSTQDKGRGADTGYGQRLLINLVKPLAQEITEFCETGARKHGKYRKLVKPIPAETAAYITIKTVLNNLHKERTTTQVAMDIGLYIEDEQRFAAFKELNPEYYNVIMKDFKRKNTKAYRHMRNVLAVTSKKKGLAWDEWSKETRLGVGSMLLDQLIKATDLIRVDKKKLKSNKFSFAVVPTPEALEWITGYNEYASLLHPYTKPCVIQPDEWTGINSGGYWSEPMRHRNPFIKGLSTSEQKFVEDHDMTDVFHAVNAIQNTEWQVNTDVLHVIKQVWENDLPIGLPKKEPIDIPRFHDDTKPKDMDEATFKEFLKWKVSVAQLYTDEVARSSKAFEVARVISMAQSYAQYDAMWFVYQCDFRGRLYASSSGLNPQGADYNKALLKFNKGVPLGDNGLYWLAVHGANCFGVDKVSFDDRVQWVTDNLQYIEATKIDPMALTDFWGEADKPYMFLAFCLEYAEAVYDPDYVSYLPIGMDGSCNGLQNFSALLRDIIGGAATNLLPSDKPSDIYQQVADRALELIRALPHSDHRTEWLAFVDKHGLSRKIAKRSVMTLPYGCTKYACFGFIADAVKDIDADFFKDSNKSCAYLTDVLWDAIADTVVAAKDAMTWLQTIAKITSERNLPVWWVNPIGFPVYQSAKKMDSKQIRTSLMGGMRLRLNKETTTISTEKQMQSIAPNFVHSLDSAHMLLTVQDAVNNGITDFAMIHDDFGTHAGNVELFRHSIKSAFVSMYTDHEPLNDIYITTALSVPDGVVPPLPDSGDLDIKEVMYSEYFFA